MKSNLIFSYLRTYRDSQISIMGSSLDDYSGQLPKAGMMRNGCIYPLEISVECMNENGYGLWGTPSASDTANRAPSTTPHITKNGTLRHINKAGGQSQQRLSQQVKYWSTPVANDGETSTLLPAVAHWDSLSGDLLRSGHMGCLNPDWVETLLSLPVGWTSVPHQRDKGHISIRTNRRALRRKTHPTARTVLKRSATVCTSTQFTRSSTLYSHGWSGKRERG